MRNSKTKWTNEEEKLCVTTRIGCVVKCKWLIKIEHLFVTLNILWDYRPFIHSVALLKYFYFTFFLSNWMRSYVCMLHYVHTFFIVNFFLSSLVQGVVAYRPIEFTHSWFCMFHLSDMHTMNVNEPLMFLSYPPVYLPHRFAAKWKEKKRRREETRYIISRTLTHTQITHWSLQCVILLIFFFASFASFA